jgi:hypothetical protein
MRTSRRADPKRILNGLPHFPGISHQIAERRGFSQWPLVDTRKYKKALEFSPP